MGFGKLSQPDPSSHHKIANRKRSCSFPGGGLAGRGSSQEQGERKRGRQHPAVWNSSRPCYPTWRGACTELFDTSLWQQGRKSWWVRFKYWEKNIQTYCYLLFEKKLLDVRKEHIECERDRSKGSRGSHHGQGKMISFLFWIESWRGKRWRPENEK